MEPISRIDPSINKLYYRGLDAIELARTKDFESILYLLVHGVLPDSEQRDELERRLIELRGLYSGELQSLNDLVLNLSQLSDKHELNLYETLLSYVALCPIVIANQFNMSKSQITESPKKELGHAENFLWMIESSKPIKADLNDFQTSLILSMDDPDNPSLTALQGNLEKGDVSDALLAALKEHVSPLHHGAGSMAMAMFEDIKKADNAKEHLELRLRSGEKIYGLGHRIYRGIDPRAAVLREILARRLLKTKDEWILHVSDAVIEEGKLLLSKYKGIQVFPNIDLYNAAVYFTFGFPPDLNTSLFAISRSAGWIAHIWELANKKTFQKK